MMLSPTLRPRSAIRLCQQNERFKEVRTAMNELRTYEGGCHCERVRFRVTADLDDVIICNCSICTKKGIIHSDRAAGAVRVGLRQR